jgi:hypothetical protein
VHGPHQDRAHRTEQVNTLKQAVEQGKVSVGPATGVLTDHSALGSWQIDDWTKKPRSRGAGSGARGKGA